MQISAAQLDAEQTYRLMTGIVVPRPIAWISTLNPRGGVNLAPFSCYTIVSNKPPMLGINIGRKAGERKDTANNILAREQFVVNIGDETLCDAIHASAQEYPAEISETELLQLTVQPSVTIATPRLSAVPINLECRLHSVTPYGETGAEFYVGEVLTLHIRDGLLCDGKIDTVALRPLCRIGGPKYAPLGPIITLPGIGQTAKSTLSRAQA